MPADPPIPAVLHLLNNAAHALANDNKQYAQLFVNDAIRVLASGVTKGWYSATDIEPVKAERKRGKQDASAKEEAAAPNGTSMKQ